MPTDINTLMSQFRSRNTVLSKHDLQVILDEAVLRAGEAGGGGSTIYGSVQTGIAPFTTPGGSTPNPGANTPTIAVVGTNIVAGPSNGVTVAGNPSPRFTIDAGNGGDYQLSLALGPVTAFAGGDAGITWDFYMREGGVTDLPFGRRITTGPAIGDLRPVVLEGIVTLAAGEFIELFVEPTTAGDLTLNTYMATLVKVD